MNKKSTKPKLVIVDEKYKIDYERNHPNEKNKAVSKYIGESGKPSWG